MHEAYDSAHLLKLTVQIESLAAYGDNLLVGTRQGHLLMYKVTSGVGTRKHEVQLLRYNKNFSKKPIQQLAVVPVYEILIRLSDNIISVHDMSSTNFSPLTTLQQTKGATLFTHDVKHTKTLTGGSSVFLRICVVVKRKLLCYYWKNSDFHPLVEITVRDVPLALVWCNETICVGYKNDYAIVNLDKTQKDLFPTGKHQEPSVTKLSDEMFILGKDTQSVLVKTAGDAVSNLAVKWSEVPINLVYDEPYLLALLPESIEVRTVDPHLLIQSLPVKARLACGSKQGLVYVASSEHVWCVQSQPVSLQIRVLLEQKQFQLAVKLTNLSDDLEEEKAKNIHQIKTLFAFDLFHNKKFHDSMKEFLVLETDPYDVIRLFPMLLPQQATRDETKTVDKSSLKLDALDLESGLLALIEYLTEVRRKLLDNKSGDQKKNLESKSTQQLMQIIDTTLLKCYLQTNDALVAPLLRRNYCHLEETEYTLKKHHKYSELIILYQRKGLHHKALELLQKQANQPDSSLRGHERTVQYLQTLGEENVNLIFQFAGWVLEAHPEDGLKIFTEDTAEVEHLPRPKVLDYLLRTQKSLVIPYLEHVVHTWKDTNSIFHNVLIHQYKEKVQTLLNGGAQQEQQAAQHIRAKLLAFLDKSDHYIPETVLVHFPFDCLFEERAIILGKLARHEQALSIYVSVLSDIQRAKEYCDKVYKQGGPGADEVYVLLMRLLISPPDNWLAGPNASPAAVPQPDLETALSLLEGNADRIPPLKALQELPDSVPLIRIKHFLMTSLQKQLNERRNTQMLKSLIYTEHLQVQEQRMQYESRSVVMTETMVCKVCRKRFGNQSAFVRYPNGDIVHYNCRELPKIS